MKVLVIGGGGREHTLVWKLAQSPKVEDLYCIPGNAGTRDLAATASVKVGGDFSELAAWVEDQGIDLTVVGPEAPLAAGVVDVFEERGLRVFGPAQAGAQIEASKVLAKELMMEAGIPTGRAEAFDEAGAAVKFVRDLRLPIVVKADGLAAGKGVTVCRSREEAEQAVRSNLEDRQFGEASGRILVEEFLEGEEASVLAFTDGKTVVAMESAQDHKPIYDGDRGPNTGGMGSYSPAPVVDDEMGRMVEEQILKPAVAVLAKRGVSYRGVLYAGLMITSEGPKVVEFNCRFGDPEAQAVLPRLETDLVDVMEAVQQGRLEEISLRWSPKAAVCVVLASGGYPGPYAKGKVIEGLDEVPRDDETLVFHAGTALRDGKVVTNGGRVLGLTTLDESLERAIEKNYAILDQIQFDGCQYRRDIGKRALERLRGK